ncbi:MAG: calcium/sodium antiporter [Candidatus Paceibacterota bacterium]
MTLFWIAVFIFSLALLVKSADWLLVSAERIGLSWGLSPFIVGVVIVGLGTSFPEFAASVAAVYQGVTEIVVANAVGSNIANILLVVGLAAIIGKKLEVNKNLIDLDLPLLIIATIFFVGVVYDGEIVFIESVFLSILFIIYFLYTIFYKDTEHKEFEEGRVEIIAEENPKALVGKKVGAKEYGFLLIGVIGLVVGAHFLVDSVISLAEIFNIGVGVITLAAVALGTSLPELTVSIKAAVDKKPEVALGNIFGSNAFNLLLVVGVPGLFSTLIVDNETLTLGLPVMIAATFIFLISGISRRIHIYEGAMYLAIYIFFLGTLLGVI